MTVPLLAQAPPAASAPSGSGVVLTIENQVEFARASEAAWSPAQTNQVLRAGDRLRTGERSRAAVRLTDLSILRLSELTTIELQTLSPGAAKPTLCLKRGMAYFFSRDRPQEIRLRTPLVSGAIRGTEFNAAVEENGRTVVTMFEGAVDLQNDQGRVQLASGEQAAVDPGQAPAKTAVIATINIIQWCLYYPAVIEVAELAFSAEEQQALTASLMAYRRGDVLQALAQYPQGRTPHSPRERVYLAGLLLAVGQVERCEAWLESATPGAEAGGPPVERWSAVLRRMIAAVQRQPEAAAFRRTPGPVLASEWLAESYYQQSRAQLEAALKAARAAVAQSPEFGFGWARVAELEFSFGRVAAAQSALAKALSLSPCNAQALAVHGFLLSAQSCWNDALAAFDQAVATDGALANGWLGRGLVRIRQGQAEAGRQDLEVAAALEPQRAVLRSYLGKAFSHTRDTARAVHELALAKGLDPHDPTAWLYSAMLDWQQNQVNQAVRDLEKSKELNDNRSLFRSRLLLDQDQAVRSANLAAIYRDAGMTDLSVREAAQAVNYDYANYSAHLFLANSYDALRDPRSLNLRYETPWFNELLLANLLMPVGAGSLSQNVSQQEYSRLFAQDYWGISSSTEYASSGDWRQDASQYGTLGKTSYALDTVYYSQNGFRDNEDLYHLTFYAKLKQQLTPQDSLFLQTIYYDRDRGDVRPLYQDSDYLPGYRSTSGQNPSVFLGYHREWQPGWHTLFLAARLAGPLEVNSPDNLIWLLAPPAYALDRFSINYHRDLEAYSGEWQQIWQQLQHTVIFGARYQSGEMETETQQAYTGTVALRRPFFTPAPQQANRTDLERYSVYGYYQWQVLPPLRLIAGISYDGIVFPRNIDYAPISSDLEHQSQVSPKAGFIWTLGPNTTVRGNFTRSLGGVFYDGSVRLEPSQVAGFTQAYRSLIPESVVGLVPGTEFETRGVALDQTFKTGTYLGLEGEVLSSDADQQVGAYALTAYPASATTTRQNLEYQERNLKVTLNQLWGQDWAVGATYRLSEADLNLRLPEIPNGPAVDQRSTLYQASLYALFNHPRGFLARAESLWTAQSNRGTDNRPGDAFWQFNTWVGYRFPRRCAEVRIGVLNWADRDYHLNPINLYAFLPRERTYTLSLRFNF